MSNHVFTAYIPVILEDAELTTASSPTYNAVIPEIFHRESRVLSRSQLKAYWDDGVRKIRILNDYGYIPVILEDVKLTTASSPTYNAVIPEIFHRESRVLSRSQLKAYWDDGIRKIRTLNDYGYRARRQAIAMTVIFMVMVLFATNAAAMGNDDPVLTMLKVDQLEITDIGDNNDVAWDAQGWIGQDLNKLWVKTEAEHAEGEFEEAELQLLYSKAIAPYWDAQIGWRHDIKPKPNRDWLVLGIQGVAPYFFETDIALFLGEGGIIGLRTEWEYELLLTQKWVLTPEIEANFFNKNDHDVGLGSGLSDIELGLRLRYEIRREFAPYIGVEWGKQFGDTANFSRKEGEAISTTKWVAGLRLWF